MITYSVRKPAKNKDLSLGHVLVELLIVAPVLLMIPAGVLEYTRFLRYDQLAVSFSQEAANQAYRQCADWNAVTQGETTVAFDEVTSTRLTEECLDRVIQDVQPRMDQRIPGGRSRVILSVYRYNYGLLGAVTTDNPETKIITQVAIRPTQGGTDPFVNSRVRLHSGDKVLARSTDNVILVSAAQAVIRERMVVAEVTFGYDPVFSLFNAFMGANSARTDGGFRETTIL